MAEDTTVPKPTSGDSFAKAFLPGLILGLVIGGAAGAFLPDLLSPRPKLPTAPAPTGPRTSPRDEGPKDGQPTAEDGQGKTQPTADEEKAAKQDPATPPAGSAEPPPK